MPRVSVFGWKTIYNEARNDQRTPHQELTKALHMSDPSTAADRAAERARREARLAELYEKRAAAEEEAEDDLFGCSSTCMAISMVVLSVLVAALVSLGASPADPLDSRVEVFRQDQMLRTVVWPGTSGPTGARNSPQVDWAVFFYKPYCGACKRVWPIFRALAATTNSSGRLRFGEVDCQSERGVCSMLKAEKTPLIRLYRAVPAKDGLQKPGRFKREAIREWQGMLIAYEIKEWFVNLKDGPDAVIDYPIEWPSAEALADAMHRFKLRGKTQHDSSLSRRPTDPAGYLVDAELALTQGLTDHVFPYADMPLTGERLRLYLRWLELQSAVFPTAAVRARLLALHTRLQARESWEQEKLEAAVRAQNFSMVAPSDGDWRWCSTAGGRGGYSCALWILFHTTLANTARPDAGANLQAIAAWVGEFFGCDQCARHFMAYWEEHRGFEQHGHIEAVLWLWHAHNMVTRRLRAEDEQHDGAPSTRPFAFPTQDDCADCYNASKTGARLMYPSLGAVEEHSVFEYHQEVYCFESDTMVCTGFDDPSKDAKSRGARPAKPWTGEGTKSE